MRQDKSGCGRAYRSCGRIKADASGNRIDMPEMKDTGAEDESISDKTWQYGR